MQWFIYKIKRLPHVVHGIGTHDVEASITVDGRPTHGNVDSLPRSPWHGEHGLIDRPAVSPQKVKFFYESVKINEKLHHCSFLMLHEKLSFLDIYIYF